MRTRCLLSAIIATATTWPAGAMTVSDYLTRRDERAITFYVAGVGAGYYYAVNSAAAIGQAALYCPGTGRDPGGQFYNDLLNTSIAAKGDSLDRGVSVEMVLLGALMTLYPCR